MTITKIQAAALSALLIAGVAVPVWQHQKNKRLAAENASLQGELVDLASLRQANEELTRRLADASTRQSADKDELLKLRAEVTALRNVNDENAQLKQDRQQLTQQLEQAAAEEKVEKQQEAEERQIAVARMTYGKQLGLALLIAASENHDQMPTNWDRLPEIDIPPGDANLVKAAQLGIHSGRFEQVYRGPLDGLLNPEQTILIREKQAYQASTGKWLRTYVFADGHAELHASSNGDYTAWEAGLAPQLKPQ